LGSFSRAVTKPGTDRSSDGTVHNAWTNGLLPAFSADFREKAADLAGKQVHILEKPANTSLLLADSSEA